MKAWGAVIFALALAGCDGVVADGAVADAKATGSMPNFSGVPRHPVTDEMRRDSTGLVGREAPRFVLPDQKSQEVSLDKMLAESEIFLVATKDGCPCSIESQPFFNAIAEAYADGVQFVGLLDAARPVSTLYAGSMSLPYSLAADPEKEAIKAIGAPQSAYVFHIGQDGVIKKVWPGYSQAMLAELNEAAAKAAGAEPKPLDFDGAPDEMTSGCYFFKPDPVLGG